VFLPDFDNSKDTIIFALPENKNRIKNESSERFKNPE
jgi:hypothetical protein